MMQSLHCHWHPWATVITAKGIVVVLLDLRYTQTFVFSSRSSCKHPVGVLLRRFYLRVSYFFCCCRCNVICTVCSARIGDFSDVSRIICCWFATVCRVAILLTNVLVASGVVESCRNIIHVHQCKRPLLWYCYTG